MAKPAPCFYCRQHHGSNHCKVADLKHEIRRLHEDIRDFEIGERMLESENDRLMRRPVEVRT